MKFFILIFSFYTSFLFSQEESFYSIIQNNKKEILEKGLTEMEKYKVTLTLKVYIGAIEAKLAQFEKNPQQKINRFKKGVELIENGIKSEPNNVEFRFIRFIIQDKAPKILRYNTNVIEDKKIIENKYSICSNVVKKNILKYSKENKSLQIN